MMQFSDDALAQMITIMTGHRYEHNIRKSYRIENDINQTRQQLKTDNFRAVNEHEYGYATYSLNTSFNPLHPQKMPIKFGSLREIV